MVKENGRRVRAYSLTSAGRKQLSVEEDRWSSVVLAVQRVLRLA
jgi:DNA-binding PadR family transcriptional regulator